MKVSEKPHVKERVLNYHLRTRNYKHFIELVKLLRICLKFEITSEEVQIVRDGFIKWVQDCEK